MLLHKWFSLLDYFSEEAFLTGFNILGKFLSKFFFLTHLFLVSMLLWQHSLSLGSLGNSWTPRFFCLQCYQVNVRIRERIYRYFWSGFDFEKFYNNSLGRINPFFAQGNAWICWRWGDWNGLALISKSTTTSRFVQWSEQIKIIVLSFHAIATRALDISSLDFVLSSEQSLFSKMLYLMLTTLLFKNAYISSIYPVHFKTSFKFVILNISEMPFSGNFFTKSC